MPRGRATGTLQGSGVSVVGLTGGAGSNRLTERGDESTQLMPAGGVWRDQIKSFHAPRGTGVEESGYEKMLREEWFFMPVNKGPAKWCGLRR